MRNVILALMDITRMDWIADNASLDALNVALVCLAQSALTSIS